MVILTTYGMKYFTMEAVSQASILAQTRASVHMCYWRESMEYVFEYGHQMALISNDVSNE